MTWTSEEENSFLCVELASFKALREKKGCERYGKVMQFLAELYVWFIARFPLKDGETAVKKREVISFVSTCPILMNNFVATTDMDELALRM